ncbi:helix-turn-helix transcriptional regulator [Amycolatopsis anabasis]|uniref:helix-turn-helix transcriptional regulator n=1 Tax=Amycolatopsis anabasis TaxID=1840409 RepID=UPI00131A7788|nr:response regulator transcription factor [Amycolatopsis anabasis]
MNVVNGRFAPPAGKGGRNAMALAGDPPAPRRPSPAPWQPRLVRSAPDDRPARSSRRLSVVVFSEIPLLCEGFARLVERMPEAELADTVHSVQAADARLRARPVDVLVVDEQADPRFDAVRVLSRRHVRTSVTVLLAPRTPATAHAAEAMRAGAANAVPAAARTELLTEAIRHATRRELPETADSDTGGFRTVVEFGGPGGVLSPRETEILQLIAQGLDNHTIAQRLVLSVETVRTHARNLARKLGARSRVQVAAIAYQSGFVTTTAE